MIYISKYSIFIQFNRYMVTAKFSTVGMFIIISVGSTYNKLYVLHDLHTFQSLQLSLSTEKLKFVVLAQRQFYYKCQCSFSVQRFCGQSLMYNFGFRG
jgi:hypothetical protein